MITASHALVWELASVSEPGAESEANGDSLLMEPALGLCAIADGVGKTHEAQVASSLAIGLLRSAVAKRITHLAMRDTASTLRDCFHAANHALLERSRLNGRRLRTTLTAVLIRGRTLYCCHCGDSRAYLSDGGGLRRVTDDHTLVGDMVRSRLLSERDAKDHPRRNILSGCLGLHERCKVQTVRCAAVPGHVLILCTDGVWAYLSEDDLASQARSGTSPGFWAKHLVQEALNRGSPDDRSVLVVGLQVPQEQSLKGLTRI